MAKPIEFLGDSLDALRAFPQDVRQSAGFQLDLVQQGLEPNDWKPMQSVGSGVNEFVFAIIKGNSEYYMWLN